MSDREPQWRPMSREECDKMQADLVERLRAKVVKWLEATSNRDREIIKVCDERDALRAEYYRGREWRDVPVVEDDKP